MYTCMCTELHASSLFSQLQLTLDGNAECQSLKLTTNQAAIYD